MHPPEDKSRSRWSAVVVSALVGFAGTAWADGGVNPAPATVMGSLDKGLIQKVVKAKRAEVMNCAERVATWVFPAPQGGGSVKVTYPFQFNVPPGKRGVGRLEKL